MLCEPQYKPSIENQAISRAYRMGQSRNVLVYRLLCKDTIDERIMSILERKQGDFNAFADKSAAAEADMQNELEIKQEQLNAMFDEEIKRLESLMPPRRPGFTGGLRVLAEGTGKQDCSSVLSFRSTL